MSIQGIALHLQITQMGCRTGTRADAAMPGVPGYKIETFYAPERSQPILEIAVGRVAIGQPIDGHEIGF